MTRRLYRSRKNRMVAGVCAGIGNYADVDPTVVRLAWVLATLFPMTMLLGFFGYLLAWAIIPEEQAA